MMGLFGVAMATASLFIALWMPRAKASFFTYEIVKEYPHDHRAFTQGLEYEHSCNRSFQGMPPKCQDILWESTGMYGESQVRAVDLQTGNVMQATDLIRSDFGEGLVRDSNGHLVQLLWRTGKTYKYDPETLQKVETLNTGLKDGWGVATDGKQLFVTDSSTMLHTVDTNTHKVIGSKEITWQDKPVKWVNELEWIDGEIWGNIWQTECIVRIDPRTAEVKSWILMKGLTASTRRNQVPRMDVLNGIAWDAKRRRIFVTGKYWPKLYEISLKEVDSPEELENMQKEVQQICMRPRF